MLIVRQVMATCLYIGVLNLDLFLKKILNILFKAAFGGHTNIANILLLNDADVNSKSIDGMTPLHAGGLKY